MTAFFISDLHLNQPSDYNYKLFIKFFATLPKDTKAIYILGDLFEAWIDDRINNEFLNNIKHILRKTTEQCNIFFIPGNRDFLIGETFAKQTNITILPDLYKINLYGKNILLSHGDLLCTLDRKHIYYSKIIRHPIMLFTANIVPLKFKLWLAKILRKISAGNINQGNMTTKHLARYDIYQPTVDQIIQKYAADLIIHGHTHKPNVYSCTISATPQSYTQSYVRIVLGDWQAQAKILQLTPSGHDLITITI